MRLDRIAGGGHAVLGAKLQLPERLDGWLLLGLDGSGKLYVDGKEVWKRTTNHRRHGGWSSVRLQLEAGSHTLIAVLERPRRGTWALLTRLLDGRDALAPRDARWLLPGTDARDVEVALQRLLRADLRAGLKAERQTPRLAIRAPHGVPDEAKLVATASVSGVDKARSFALGHLPRGPRGVAPLVATLPSWSAADLPDWGKLEARVEVAGARLTAAPVQLSAKAMSVLASSAAVTQSLDGSTWLDAQVLKDTVAQLSTEVESAAELRHGGQLKRAVDRLKVLSDDLRQHKDPLLDPGSIELARRSSLDGRPQPFRLHIPRSYSSKKKPDKQWPLVVLLHGYNGSPRGIMEAFFDSKSLAPRVDGFVLAPHAHGNAFYRDAGEASAMEMLDWVLARYPIDPERVSVTGVSMGGTGTGYLALRYAPRFAAASPLCGYHSYFVRRDTSKRFLRPWEKARMHHWSPASWAKNGRHLPMFVAHGTQDHPLDNSRVLVRRYKELGYSMSDDWPDTGHAVWEKTWKGARMWPWLTRHRRPTQAKHLSLETTSLRYGEQRWLKLTAQEKPGRRSSLDAKLEGATIQLTTSNVAGLDILRGKAPLAAGAVSVEVDGTSLDFNASEQLALKREGGSWQKGSAGAASHKRAGLEGPIRDAFLGPVLVVYGTRRRATARITRELGEAFAKHPHGAELEYPLLSDRELTPEQERTHHLLLVGGAGDNLVAARLSGLPSRVEGETLHFGKQRFDGPQVGSMYVFPNRERGHYVVVVTGTTIAGLLSSLSLPRLLPDFLVYDDQLGAAAGEQVLSAGRVLAGGFFERDWTVPTDHHDPAPD